MKRRDEDTIRPPSPPKRRQATPTTLGLWIVSSPDHERIGTVIPLAKDGIQCGRGEAVSEQINDDWLSRDHFSIGVAKGSDLACGPWWLEDRQTRNGTFVAGISQHRCQLALGDVIRAGATVAVFDRGCLEFSDDLGLVGHSASIARLRDQVIRFARGRNPLHIRGESGAGKEVVARALHTAGAVRGPFLGVNMAAIVQSLAESQLFGHRKGAFSGATTDQVGAFDAAADGTLLLDEIGEMALPTQAKLLRAVESGEVHRIGDARPHRCKVRLLTATHRDLRAMVHGKAFRDDLYWRLAHTVIDVPPLRQRRLDVVPLLEHFLEDAGAVPLAGIVRLQSRWAWHAADLIEACLHYDWPGNVRELRDEARALGDAMRARRDDAITGPIPPLEEALSARVRQARVDPVAVGTPAKRGYGSVPEVIDSGGHAIIDPVQLAAEAVRYKGLLADADALAAAIRFEADGNIKRFAQMAAAALGRKPSSVRRTIYRTLGDGVQSLRTD